MDQNEVNALFKKLQEPFAPAELEWRAQAPGGDLRDKQNSTVKCLALAYIQARAIANRLDNVVGANNWYDAYSVGPQGGVICSLTIRINNEWITKQGLAENTQIEAVKGGESDALKRAGYKWGIGRYLYELPDHWCRAQVKGKGVYLLERPAMPAWAYPADFAGTKETEGTFITMNEHLAAKAEKLNADAGVETEKKKPTPRPAATEAKKPAPEKTAQVTSEAKTAAPATAPVVEDKAAQQMAKAKAYLVPMGHSLPSEGKAFGDVLGTFPVVGVHLLNIISGRNTDKKVKPFEPKTDEDKKAVLAAAYILDNMPKLVEAVAATA